MHRWYFRVLCRLHFSECAFNDVLPSVVVTPSFRSHSDVWNVFAALIDFLSYAYGISPCRVCRRIARYFLPQGPLPFVTVRHCNHGCASMEGGRLISLIPSVIRTYVFFFIFLYIYRTIIDLARKSTICPCTCSNAYNAAPLRQMTKHNAIDT